VTADEAEVHARGLGRQDRYVHAMYMQQYVEERVGTYVLLSHDPFALLEVR